MFFDYLFVISEAQKLIFVGLFSLLFGSFLSVCIFRIPHGRPKGLESLEYDDSHEPFFEIGNLNINSPKRSFCPECKTTLKWYNNIPVFSYLFQMGKCSYCKTKIPFRYPLVEILSLVCGLACFSTSNVESAIVNYFFCCALIVITFIDLDYFIIPNIISVPGMAVGVLVGAINHFFHIFSAPIVGDLYESLIGLAFGGGFLWLVAETYKRISGKDALGFGDVKLLGMVGAFYGFQGALMTILFGSIIGSVVGGLQILVTRNKVDTPIPFGPYLAVGIVIYIFEIHKLLSDLIFEKNIFMLGL